MKSIRKLVLSAGLLLAATLVSASIANAEGYAGDYGSQGYSNPRAFSGYDDARHDRRNYRPGYGGYRSERSNAPWCPTHQVNHNHSYGYYGFNGGYYGVYDGNSYEEVFARAYDDGYSDGYNELGRNGASQPRAYRKGYSQGYRDGRRDGRRYYGR